MDLIKLDNQLITIMKRLFFIIIITILSVTVNAQKKYMLQQIAALQVYIGYLQKGYSIAKKGLNLIGDLKKGELDLHSDYFTSLKAVNPKIYNSAKIGGCISLQIQILNTYRNAYPKLKQSMAFNEEESKYMNLVFNKLIDNCAITIDELIEVTTSEKLVMKDNERLKRVDVLYNDLQDKYSFIKDFVAEAKVLAVSRLKEQKDIQNSRVINDIKN